MSRRTLSLLLGVLLVAAFLPGCAYISRASESPTGVQGDSASWFPSISANGRWVAFQSLASNLVPGDTNDVIDVFVRDNLTKKVARVSVWDDGTQGNGHSELPSISDDGRRIVFASEATNLSSDDTNGELDIYFHDRDADNDGAFDEPGAIVTELLSYTSTGGVALSGRSNFPVINGDGNGAVYESTAALAPEDTNGVSDVYSTQLYAGVFPVTRLISKPVGTPGPANGSSAEPTVNHDGSVVAFSTTATNLVAGDTNGRADVVIWDAHVSPPSLGRVMGSAEPEADVGMPSLSRDAAGQFVAFVTEAANGLPAGTGTPRPPQVYVLDRTTGEITHESPAWYGGPATGASRSPSISRDGTRLAYESEATDLVRDDTNGQPDVFVRDRPSFLTQIASTAQFLDRGNGPSRFSDVSSDGRYVAFASNATNLATPDANGPQPDVFTHAAVVPTIATVARVGPSVFGGTFVSPARLRWGQNTLRIIGQGFGPDVSVDLGAGVSVVGMQHSPSQIDLEVSVANGSSGTRNLVVDNGASPFGGRLSAQVCIGCVSIQRWVTVNDPVPRGSAQSTVFFRVLSNNEFTPATIWPGQVSFSIASSELWVTNSTLPSILGPGAHDITLEQTVNGTETCADCLHVE